MRRNDSPEWIAQRCKWAYEDAVAEGDIKTAKVLRYCLLGSTYGRNPAYREPAYLPASNTLRLLKSIEKSDGNVRAD